jgi:3-oxoacyl-[acyl-carrier protein] reductase
MGERIAGKVVVVTGGGSGLGKACALRLGEEGATGVLIVDLGKRADEAAEELSALGVDAVGVSADVSQEADCDAMASAAMERWGRIDVLVAAAGVSFESVLGPDERERKSVLDMPMHAWRRVLDVNLEGVLYSDRAVGRRMRAARSGSIVNIASICAVWNREGNAPYAVSKAGVVSLTKGLALELAPHGVRVNAVGPGYIETPMTQAAREDPDAFERVTTATPVGRFGQPREVADTVLFLASDEASFFTGEILFPDGGFLASTR